MLTDEQRTEQKAKREARKQEKLQALQRHQADQSCNETVAEIVRYLGRMEDSPKNGRFEWLRMKAHSVYLKGDLYGVPIAGGHFSYNGNHFEALEVLQSIVRIVAVKLKDKQTKKTSWHAVGRAGFEDSIEAGFDETVLQWEELPKFIGQRIDKIRELNPGDDQE